MRAYLEAQYNANIVRWNEPTDDGEAVEFAAYCGGRLIVAESLALLLSALQERTQTPLLLLAA